MTSDPSAHHCVFFCHKGYGIETDFFIINKSVWHMSITQLLSLCGFGFELADIIIIDNRLPAINSTDSADSAY